MPRRELYLTAALLSLPPLLRSLVPSPSDTERFWLTWLGRNVLATGDIPRAIGPESPLDAGAPWIPHEWLYAVACAWMQAHHVFWLFALLNALAAVSLLFVAARACERENQPPLLSAIVLIFAAVLLGSRFSLRAENFTFFALAVLLPLLNSRARWIAPLLFVVWANVHAGFALGLVIAALWAAFYPRRGSSFVLLAACIAATLATPFGVDLWRLIAWLPHSWIPRHVQEWQSAVNIAPALLLLLLVPAAFVRRDDVRRQPFRFGFTLYVLLVLASVAAVRNLPVAFALGVPLILPAVSRRLRLTHREPAFGAPLLGAVCSVALVATMDLRLPLAADSQFGAYYSRDAYVPVLERMDFGRRLVACEQPFLCNVVLYVGGRTTYDGRTDPFPESRSIAASNHAVADVVLTLSDGSSYRGFALQRFPTSPHLSVWRRLRP